MTFPFVQTKVVFVAIHSLMILIALLLLVTAVHAQVFLNEPYEVQINTPYTLISSQSSLSDRSGLPVFEVNGTGYTSYNASSSVNITFLYTGTITLTLTDILNQVVNQSVVVIPRTIMLGSVLTLVEDSDWELATLVAIDHVNNYMNLFPNSTLTLNPERMSPCSQDDAITKVMDQMTDPNPPQVIFGPSCPAQCTVASIVGGISEVPVITLCTAASMVAGSNQIPVISFKSTSDLTIASNFPFFMRTEVATQSRIASTMLDFVRRMGYKRVAVLQINIFQLAESFYSGAASYGIEVAAQVTALAGQLTFQDEIATIRTSGARVVICSMIDESQDYPEQQLALMEAIRQGIIGPDSGFIWLTVNVPQFSNVGLPVSMMPFVNGTLSTFIPETYQDSAARNDLINRWNNITTNSVAGYEYYFANSRPNNETTLFSYNYGMCGPINAVLTVANALNKLIYIDQVEYTGQTLSDTMRSMNITGPCGAIQYDNYGDFQYSLGMANYLYQYTNDGLNYQVVKNPFDFEQVIIPSIPMSVNLSNVLINGQSALSMWEPDFVCVGGCGAGTCLGANDCQCHRGYSQLSSTSNSLQAPSCDQYSTVYEDSITLTLFPVSNFLVTRAYEQAINAAVADSLHLNNSQVQTVDFGISNGNLILEFVLYSDTNQSFFILDSDLEQNMKIMESNYVPLLAQSKAQLNLVAKDVLRSNEPLGIFLLTLVGILAVLWLATVVIAIKLFRIPFWATKESDQVSRNLGFGWPLNGIQLLGIAMSLFAAYLHFDIPTDWNCNARPWLIFLSLFCILNVKVAKLYRLYKIFNNPQLKLVQLPNWRLISFYIIPGLLLIIIVLIVGDLGGRATKFLETSATISRQRAWICHRTSNSYANASSIVLITIYLILSIFGLTLRFLVRQVRASLLDHKYGDLLLFLLIPLTLAPLWYDAQKANSSWAPRFISVFAIIWMLLVVVSSLVIQQLYRYLIVLLYGMELDTHTTKYGSTQGNTNFTHNPTATNLSNIHLRSAAELVQLQPSSQICWNEFPLPQMNIRVAHVGRLLTGRWRVHNMKYCAFERNNEEHQVLFFHRPKDWTGFALTESSIVNVMEINPSMFILRLFTRSFGSYLMQAEDAASYSNLLSIIHTILSLSKGNVNVSGNSLDLLSR